MVGKSKLVLNSLAIAILIFLSVIENSGAENNRVEADIVAVNQELGFFIVSAGEAQGVKIGNEVKIFRDKKQISRGQIIEVRNEVSAAELTEPQALPLKEGYGVEIYPFKSTSSTKKQTLIWTPLFRTGSSQRVGKESPDELNLMPGGTGESINIDIDSEKKLVFIFTLQTLKNNGYSITYANRFAGIVNATKQIGLSLPAELWADFTAAIDHKMLLKLDIKESNNISNLSIAANLEHIQKGKRIEGPVNRTSKFYSDILKIAGEIKKLSEEKTKIEVE